jgi:hypothetical protein
MIVDVSVSVSALVVVAAGVNGNAPVDVSAPRGRLFLSCRKWHISRIAHGTITSTESFPFTPAATSTGTLTLTVIVHVGVSGRL